MIEKRQALRTFVLGLQQWQRKMPLDALPTDPRLPKACLAFFYIYRVRAQTYMDSNQTWLFIPTKAFDISIRGAAIQSNPIQSNAIHSYALLLHVPFSHFV
jgi:hypothetical protein